MTSPLDPEVLGFDPYQHHGNTPSQAKRDYCARRYGEGATVMQIAAELGITKQAVSGMLKRTGVTTRPTGGNMGVGVTIRPADGEIATASVELAPRPKTSPATCAALKAVRPALRDIATGTGLGSFGSYKGGQRNPPRAVKLRLAAYLLDQAHRLEMAAEALEAEAGP